MKAITSNGNYVYYVTYCSKPQNFQSHVQFAKNFINSISIDSNISPSSEGFAAKVQPNYLTYENSTFGIKVEYLGDWSIRQEGSTVDNQTNNIVYDKYNNENL